MIRSKWPFYCLMAAPYLFVAASVAVYLVAGGLSGDGPAGVCLLLVLMLAGVCVPATANALRLSAGEGDGRELLRWTRRVKLSLIPFYLLLFLTTLILAITLVGLLLVPALLVAGYVMLLPSSMYGLAALRRLRRQGLLDDRRYRTHAILLFVLAADVISVADLHEFLPGGEK